MFTLDSPPTYRDRYVSQSNIRVVPTTSRRILRKQTIPEPKLSGMSVRALINSGLFRIRYLSYKPILRVPVL
jgi:hypothetical protein